VNGRSCMLAMIEDDGQACGKSMECIHAHAGMGLSMQQLSGMYRASHGIQVGLNGLSASSCLCLGGGGGGGVQSFGGSAQVTRRCGYSESRIFVCGTAARRGQ
jgi:hypothetical protein